MKFRRIPVATHLFAQDFHFFGCLSYISRCVLVQLGLVFPVIFTFTVVVTGILPVVGYTVFCFQLLVQSFKLWAAVIVFYLSPKLAHFRSPFFGFSGFAPVFLEIFRQFLLLFGQFLPLGAVVVLFYFLALWFNCVLGFFPLGTTVVFLHLLAVHFHLLLVLFPFGTIIIFLHGFAILAHFIGVFSQDRIIVAIIDVTVFAGGLQAFFSGISLVCCFSCFFMRGIAQQFGQYSRFYFVKR